MRSWPTPTKAIAEGGQTSRSGARKDEKLLSGMAREWATPNAQLHNYLEDPESYAARSARLVEQGTRPLGVNLGQQAQTWATPTTRNDTGPSATKTREGAADLQTQVRSWPTPAARDSKGTPLVLRTENSRPLNEVAVALWSGRLDLETSKAWPESPPRTRTSSRLNPAFCEWLMGWPEGSSLPMPAGLTGSDSSATELCQHKRQQHGDSSGSTSKPGSE
jgi:hypothetical protein